MTGAGRAFRTAGPRRLPGNQDTMNPMITQHLTAEMERCIRECIACYEVCLETAVNHQLGLAEMELDPAHLRLLISCAEICQTTTRVMMTGSPLHKPAARICAKLCRRCAAVSERCAGTERCAQAARACAEWCQRIAA